MYMIILSSELNMLLEFWVNIESEIDKHNIQVLQAYLRLKWSGPISLNIPSSELQPGPPFYIHKSRNWRMITVT